MEIVLAAVVAAAVAAGVAVFAQRSGVSAPRNGGRSATLEDSTTGEGPTTAVSSTTAPADPEGAAAGRSTVGAAFAGAENGGGGSRVAAGNYEASNDPSSGSTGSHDAASSAEAGVGHRTEAGLDGASPGASPADRSGHAAIEAELRARRAEIARIEERLLSKEEAVEVRLAELGRKGQSLDDRARNLDQRAEALKAAKQEHTRELERIAGLSASQAKQILLRELEDELHQDSARLIRQVEEQTRRDADRRARNILAACMQRVAGGHATETTVSVVSLESDDLKGRIIGREGRNIRTLEMLTGIDFIIDDTPCAVILSGFDGVRREIARLTLEKLLQDGRIHPARIEEAYNSARSEIDQHIAEAGDQAAFEANVATPHAEITKLLGRLRYRTSYGQNVLAHSIECAHVAALIADELGASAKTARRAALLHDIGKAVSHEVEGPHALVGGELARRYGESEAVAHAMEAHHDEVEMQTIEAVIVQVADAVSGARPGARGESLDQYVKRLRELEEVALRHPGVEKVYAMQAGREVRVIVRPEEVDDDAAVVLSRKVARDVENGLEYPGQIKVTVIRESRAVDYAR